MEKILIEEDGLPQVKDMGIKVYDENGQPSKEYGEFMLKQIEQYKEKYGVQSSEILSGIGKITTITTNENIY